MTEDGPLAALRKRWTLVIIFAILGLLGGLAYSLLAPKVYSASAQVLIAVEANTAADRLQGATYIQQILPTYTAAVTSSTVLAPVIESEGLNTTLQELRRRVDVQSTTESAVITIKASSETAEDSFRLTQAITDRFVAVAPGLISPSSTPPTQPSQPASEVPAKVVLIVVDQPLPPSVPDSPRLVLGIPVGLSAGLIVGVCVALFLRSIDTRVYSLDRVTEITGVRVIAEIPARRTIVSSTWNWPGDTDGPANAGKRIQSWPNPYVENSEAWVDAIRALRSAVFSWDRQGQSILLTGVIPMSGTTTVTVALASALANSGVNTLVVDGNLRTPALHQAFGLDRTPGLTDVLVGDTQPFVAERQIPELPRLTVVTAGSRDESGDLIASPRLTHVIQDLGRDRRTVLIDGAALTTPVDVRVLAPLVSATVLLIPLGRITERQLSDGVAELGRSGNPLIGVVVTTGFELDNNKRGRRSN